MLAAGDFRAVLPAIVGGATRGRGIVWGLGAHVIKTGLSPAADRPDGARASCRRSPPTAPGSSTTSRSRWSGATSEDVEQALGAGQFGMADETGRLLNGAINEGVAAGLGIGQAVGRYLCERHPQHERASIAAAASRLGIPLTVHVAIGTDIIHMHPDADGALSAEGSLRDFRYFVSNVARLEHGVYLNCGSAVILPEVFLKAVSLARNRGAGLEGLTTVTLDFARLYRPQINVVSRPTSGTTGKGYYLVGHHEMLIPLLAAALVEGSEKPC